MELNEMEKKMLFQAEGDCQAKVLNTKPIKNISAIPMIPIAGLLFAMRPLTLPVCWQRSGNGKSPLNT